MAITALNQVSASGGYTDNGGRKWTIIYKAVTDNKNDGPLTVLSNAGIPAYLSGTYAFGNDADTGAFRRSVDCELLTDPTQGGSWKVWEITVNYSTDAVESGNDANANATNPTQLSEERWWSFTRYQKSVEKDAFGEPVVNGAGDRFFDLTKQAHHISLFVKKHYNKADYKDLELDENIDHTNSKKFYDRPERSWLVSINNVREYRHGSSDYFEVTYEFEAAPPGENWDVQPANIGPRYIEAGTGTYKRFTDDEGFDYGDGLGTLDAAGGKWTNSTWPILYYDGASPSAGDPFQIYPTLDFGDKFNIQTEL